MAKKAWKVGPELIDRFLNVLDDNGFKWMSGQRVNEFEPMWKNATLLFIKEKPKTLVCMRYWYYQTQSDEEYNITEVTEELLDEMENEGATNTYGLNIKQAENLSEVEKREIDQLIFDIRENEWYCEQGDSESQMEDWEKKLIIDGLKRLLEVCEICE